MKKYTDSNTFCIVPFIHQNIKMEGKVTVCCKSGYKLGDLRIDSLEKIWNNKTYKTIRKKLLNNENPIECKNCWNLEHKGIKSSREIYNSYYQNTFDLDYNTILSQLSEDYSLLYNLKSIEIRFDNTCNLMCRHCSPIFSSKWESAFRKNKKVKEFFIKHESNLTENNHITLSENTLIEIKSSASSIQEIVFSGGEPLIQKMHWKMIDELEMYAHNITLVYNSNLNQLGIGNYSVLESWPKFKKILLRASVDGDEKTYDYFRVNGKIELVKQNLEILKNLKNLEIHLSVTINIYNITRLTDMILFSIKHSTLFHVNMLQYPLCLNIKVLPKNVKDDILKKWKYFTYQLINVDEWNQSLWNDINLKLKQIKLIYNYGEYIMKYMMSDDLSHYLKDTKEYIKFQDELHSTTFEKFYPELVSHIF